MAATYILKASNNVFGNAKSMISLWNGAGSTDVLKVNRIILLNNQVGIAAGTGVLVELQLRKITAHTVGTKLFPQKRRLASADLHANVIGSMGATVTEASQVLRRVFWSGDEPANAELNTDTLSLIPNFTTIWDSGYNSTVIEPIVLRASEGIHVKCNTSTSATHMGDIIVEFTT